MDAQKRYSLNTPLPRSVLHILLGDSWEATHQASLYGTIPTLTATGKQGLSPNSYSSLTLGRPRSSRTIDDRLSQSVRCGLVALMTARRRKKGGG